MSSYFTKKIQAAVKTKTCILCELGKSLSEFSPGNKRCKVCQANFYVVCGGCKTKRHEGEMKIYDVAIDKYFCNEPCRNRYYGIKRNRNGEII